MEESLEHQENHSTEKSIVTHPIRGITASSKFENGSAIVENAESAVSPAIGPLEPRQPSHLPRKPGSSNQDLMSALLLHEGWRQLALSLFFLKQTPVRSLGFTSTLGGEGKTFLARLMAAVLAEDSSEPVALVECNWDHPNLHEYYGVSDTPGLAEWLRGECSKASIRHLVSYNLTLIPAGNANKDEVRLLRQLRCNGLLQVLAAPNELLVVDLPPIMTAGYGRLAADLVETLLLVVRAGVTPNQLVAEACMHLKDLPVAGIVLNQVKSQIPRWIRQML